MKMKDNNKTNDEIVEEIPPPGLSPPLLLSSDQ